MDQSEVSVQRLKIKHHILNMTNNALTEYTQPDLINFADDIIEFRVDDTNFDMFNKESILIGL